MGMLTIIYTACCRWDTSIAQGQSGQVLKEAAGAGSEVGDLQPWVPKLLHCHSVLYSADPAESSCKEQHDVNCWPQHLNRNLCLEPRCAGWGAWRP
jgi:hypothetical protein